MDKYACGFEDHVNEYDRDLNTSTIWEEDKRIILIIGGIRIFLPDSPIEAKECVVDATIGEGNPMVNVMMMGKISKASQEEEEEMEQKLMSTPTKKEENLE
jgi:hypothetical protein